MAEKKTSKGKASDGVRRMRMSEAMSREKPASQTESKEARTSSKAPAEEKMVRVTVDLPRSEHRFLRVFAAQSGSDGMRVMRAALQELAEDEEFASRVRDRLEEAE